MTSELTVFRFEDRDITVYYDTTGNPWWLLREVCDILGIQTSSNVAERLDPDEITEILNIDPTNVQKGGRVPLVINESGLYNVILRSDKPEAKAFKRWITHDVLPVIRKTGTYAAKPLSELELARLYLAAVEEKVRLAALIGNQENTETVRSAAQNLGITLKGRELNSIARLVAQLARNDEIYTGKVIEGIDSNRGSTAAYPKEWLREKLRDLLREKHND